MDKLNQIRLERVAYDGLPLSEVVRTLSQVIKMRDPDSRGINFFIRSDKPAEIAPSVDPATGLPTSSSRRNGFRAIDPSTGLPGVSMIASSNEVSDINTVTVTINPAMTNALLRDVLEAIVKSSDKPIKYSILDFGIRFSRKSPNQLPPLSSRRFKINTNTFFQGLAKAEGISATSRQSQPGATTLSKTNSMAAIQSRVMAFFRTEGVNLDPPKSVFYGDRDGTLWVRATVEDLDIIEAAIQTLNTAPPQININVKWIEVSKKIADTLPTGLGFLPTGTNTSTVASLLNPPQLRELLGELQNKSGVTEINDTGVTTLSGLQAQVQVTDIPSVHEKLPGTKDTSTTIPLPFGPTLDVIAYVSADGYTIELTLIPTIVEILGYDDPGQFIIQAQSGGGTHGAGNSSLSVLPLPRFHLRQETISAKVWDGQTIVIDNTPSREKNPAAPGDSDRRLLILVTPCLIDPAGNRIHTDEELISRRATQPK